MLWYTLACMYGALLVISIKDYVYSAQYRHGSRCKVLLLLSNVSIADVMCGYSRVDSNP